jgi:hypothetical protein
MTLLLLGGGNTVTHMIKGRHAMVTLVTWIALTAPLQPLVPGRETIDESDLGSTADANSSRT